MFPNNDHKEDDNMTSNESIGSDKITFVINEAIFEFTNDVPNLGTTSIEEAVAKGLHCPLVFWNFDEDELKEVFDGSWISSTDKEEGVKPSNVKIMFAELSGNEVTFEAQIEYCVTLANEDIDDSSFEDELSWPTDMIDAIALTIEGEELEELSIGEKIGPVVGELDD